MSDDSMLTHWMGCWRQHHACAVAKVEELRREVADLSQQLQDEVDRENIPCADALDKLWNDIMPDGYGDWEYPGQAYRHILAEHEDVKDSLHFLKRAVSASVIFCGTKPPCAVAAQAGEHVMLTEEEIWDILRGRRTAAKILEDRRRDGK